MTRRGWTSKVVSLIRLGRWSRETACPKIRYQKLVRCCEVTVYCLQIQGKNWETMPRKVALANISDTTTTWTQRYQNAHGRQTNKKFCSVSTRFTEISGRPSPSTFQGGTFHITQNWQHDKESFLLNHPPEPPTNEQTNRVKKQYPADEVHQAVNFIKNFCH